MDEKLTPRRIKRLRSLSTEDLILLSIEHGVDLHSKDYRGRTVLHYAVEQARVELIKFLFEKGADVDVADDLGETPLLIAAKNHKADQLVPLLMKYEPDVTVKDYCGRNALHLLTRTALSSEELIVLFRALIAKGISIDDIDERDFNYRPIHVAIRTGRNTLVEFLLDHGANIDAQANGGAFPLYLATKGDSLPSVLEVLLERGADIHMTTDRGRTALHGVCEEPLVDPKRKCIKLLLSAGVDLFAEDHEGTTAFALVCWNLSHRIYNTWGDLHPDMTLMTKAIALKKVCLPVPIELKDEGILKKDRPIWDYYQDCIRYLSKAKSTQIIRNFTFFDLLTKCRCQTVGPMRNREFERNFRLYDLNVFSMYACDMSETFERVERYYNSMLEQEDVINEAVYNALPHVIVRKMVDCIFECKMKRCA